MHDKKEVTFRTLSQESTCGIRFVSVPVSDGNENSLSKILSDEGPMLETLDYTIRFGSTPTFLYFDFYLYSAYAAHYVYFSDGNGFFDYYTVQCMTSALCSDVHA